MTTLFETFYSRYSNEFSSYLRDIKANSNDRLKCLEDDDVSDLNIIRTPSYIDFPHSNNNDDMADLFGLLHKRLIHAPSSIYSNLNDLHLSMPDINIQQDISAYERSILPIKDKISTDMDFNRYGLESVDDTSSDDCTDLSTTTTATTIATAEKEIRYKYEIKKIYYKLLIECSIQEFIHFLHYTTPILTPYSTTPSTSTSTSTSISISTSNSSSSVLSIHNIQQLNQLWLQVSFDALSGISSIYYHSNSMKSIIELENMITNKNKEENIIVGRKINHPNRDENNYFNDQSFNVLLNLFRHLPYSLQCSINIYKEIYLTYLIRQFLQQCVVIYSSSSQSTCHRLLSQILVKLIHIYDTNIASLLTTIQYNNCISHVTILTMTHTVRRFLYTIFECMISPWLSEYYNQYTQYTYSSTKYDSHIENVRKNDENYKILCRHLIHFIGLSVHPKYYQHIHNNDRKDYNKNLDIDDHIDLSNNIYDFLQITETMEIWSIFALFSSYLTTAQQKCHMLCHTYTLSDNVIKFCELSTYYNDIIIYSYYIKYISNIILLEIQSSMFLLQFYNISQYTSSIVATDTTSISSSIFPSILWYHSIIDLIYILERSHILHKDQYVDYMYICTLWFQIRQRHLFLYSSPNSTVNRNNYKIPTILSLSSNSTNTSYHIKPFQLSPKYYDICIQNTMDIQLPSTDRHIQHIIDHINTLKIKLSQIPLPQLSRHTVNSPRDGNAHIHKNTSTTTTTTITTTPPTNDTKGVQANPPLTTNHTKNIISISSNNNRNTTSSNTTSINDVVNMNKKNSIDSLSKMTELSSNNKLNYLSNSRDNLDNVNKYNLGNTENTMITNQVFTTIIGAQRNRDSTLYNKAKNLIIEKYKVATLMVDQQYEHIKWQRKYYENITERRQLLRLLYEYDMKNYLHEEQEKLSAETRYTTQLASSRQVKIDSVSKSDIKKTETLIDDIIDSNNNIIDIQSSTNAKESDTVSKFKEKLRSDYYYNTVLSVRKIRPYTHGHTDNNYNSHENNHIEVINATNDNTINRDYDTYNSKNGNKDTSESINSSGHSNIYDKGSDGLINTTATNIINPDNLNNTDSNIFLKEKLPTTMNELISTDRYTSTVTHNTHLSDSNDIQQVILSSDTEKNLNSYQYTIRNNDNSLPQNPYIMREIDTCIIKDTGSKSNNSNSINHSNDIQLTETMTHNTVFISQNNNVDRHVSDSITDNDIVNTLEIQHTNDSYEDDNIFKSTSYHILNRDVTFQHHYQQQSQQLHTSCSLSHHLLSLVEEEHLVDKSNIDQLYHSLNCEDKYDEYTHRNTEFTQEDDNDNNKKKESVYRSQYMNSYSNTVHETTLHLLLLQCQLYDRCLLYSIFDCYHGRLYEHVHNIYSICLFASHSTFLKSWVYNYMEIQLSRLGIFHCISNRSSSTRKFRRSLTATKYTEMTTNSSTTSTKITDSANMELTKEKNIDVNKPHGKNQIRDDFQSINDTTNNTNSNKKYSKKFIDSIQEKFNQCTQQTLTTLCQSSVDTITKKKSMKRKPYDKRLIDVKNTFITISGHTNDSGNKNISNISCNSNSDSSVNSSSSGSSSGGGNGIWSEYQSYIHFKYDPRISSSTYDSENDTTDHNTNKSVTNTTKDIHDHDFYKKSFTKDIGILSTKYSIFHTHITALCTTLFNTDVLNHLFIQYSPSQYSNIPPSSSTASQQASLSVIHYFLPESLLQSIMSPITRRLVTLLQLQYIMESIWNIRRHQTHQRHKNCSHIKSRMGANTTEEIQRNRLLSFVYLYMQQLIKSLVQYYSDIHTLSYQRITGYFQSILSPSHDLYDKSTTNSDRISSNVTPSLYHIRQKIYDEFITLYLSAYIPLSPLISYIDKCITYERNAIQQDTMLDEYLSYLTDNTKKKKKTNSVKSQSSTVNEMKKCLLNYMIPDSVSIHTADESYTTVIQNQFYNESTDTSYHTRYSLDKLYYYQYQNQEIHQLFDELLSECQLILTCMIHILSFTSSSSSSSTTTTTTTGVNIKHKSSINTTTMPAVNVANTNTNNNEINHQPISSLQNPRNYSSENNYDNIYYYDLLSLYQDNIQNKINIICSRLNDISEPLATAMNIDTLLSYLHKFI